MVPEVALAQHHPGEEGPQAADTPTACAAAAAATTTHKERARTIPRGPAAPPSPAGHAKTARGEGRCREQQQHTEYFESTCSIFGDSPRAQIASKASRARWPGPERPARRWHCVRGGCELALVGQLSADQRRGRHGRAVPSSAALWPGCPSHINSRIAAGPRRSSAERPPSAPSCGQPEVSEGEFQSDHEQQQRHASSDRKLSVSPGAITPMTEGPVQRRQRDTPARRAL